MLAEEILSPRRLPHAARDLARGVLLTDVLRRVQLAPPPTTREEALGSEQHHEDEGDAVEKELVLDEVEVGQDRDVDRQLLEERVHLLQEDRLDVVDDERAG